LVHRFKGHTRDVRNVAICPYGRMVASIGFDAKIRLWDVADARERHALDLPPGWVWAVSFSPDGKMLATSNDKGDVIIFDAATGKRLHPWTMPGRVLSATFAHDGRHLLTANDDGTTFILRLRPVPRPLSTVEAKALQQAEAKSLSRPVEVEN